MYVQEREREGEGEREREGEGEGGRGKKEGDVQRVVWKELQKAMKKVDPDVTPADVCTKEREGERKGGGER